MSMLSAQIDKLRELAADADVYGDTRHFRDPLNDAADTIWQLRDDLQHANAENAKLREDNDRLIQAVEDLHDVSLEDRLVQLENENAKLMDEMINAYNDKVVAQLEADELRAEIAQLRELVRDLWHLLYNWLFKAREVPYDELKAVSDRMRELGVEMGE